MPWIRGFLWDDDNVAHITRHAVSPDEVEEALAGDPVVLRGADNRYLVYGRTENDRWLFAVYGTRDDREGEASLPAQTKGTNMKTRHKVPTFRTDGEAADYWAKHDSASYAKNLPVVAVKPSPALRRRVAARAKKPVTLRLEEGQIAAAKRTAERMSIPYQTLLRMWIAQRLAKERVG